MEDYSDDGRHGWGHASLSPALRRLAGRLDRLTEGLRLSHRWLAGQGPVQTDRGAERHPVPTLLLCLDGVARIEGPPGRLDLRAGEALILAPGVWHRHAPLRPGSTHFGFGFLGDISDFRLSDHAHDLRGSIPAQPTRMLIERALAQPEPAARLRILCELLDQIGREEAAPLDVPHPAVLRMRHALWSRLHQGLTAAQMVATSGVSRSQAYALWTRTYGKSPRAVLEDCRLELARQLLTEGRGIAATAAACGFPSRAAFTRAWRQRHGQPPRAARSSPAAS